MQIEFHKKILRFNNPAGTSRGVLHEKISYIVVVRDGDKLGIGECSLLPQLSPDNMELFEDYLEIIRIDPELFYLDYQQYGLARLERMPSIRFGLEMAFMDLESTEDYNYFDSAFILGLSAIPINGLIWMGSIPFIYEQIDQKIEEEWKCIKIKIGDNNFHEEIKIIKYIRDRFNSNEVELRLDANGAFSKEEALEKLNQLAQYDIHSIEQPIEQGQWTDMAKLCEQSPIDIALDEELIGIYGKEQQRMLGEIRPAYIICKPSLLGGCKASDEWIGQANTLGIGWWATSALESNIGLSAIAQWTAQKDLGMPQGLGTGGLFQNNIDSPLYITPGQLHMDHDKAWGNLREWLN